MSIHNNDKLFSAKIASGRTERSIMLDANVLPLPDGSLFATWTGDGVKEPVIENSTYFSKSYDGGKTWEKEKILFSHPIKGVFTPEIYLYKDKLFAFTDTYYNDFGPDCHSYISKSCDNGESFTIPFSIGGAINNIHVKSGVTCGNRIIMACSWIESEETAFLSSKHKCIVSGKEYPGKNPETTGRFNWQEYCGALISDDEGETWRLCGKIGYMDGRFCEPAIMQLSDSSLYMLIRSNDDHIFYESRSYDLGETWSVIKPTHIPSSICKPALAKSQDGRIYLIFNPDTSGKRSPLSLWISYDDMKTWSHKIDLLWSDADEPLAYPDAFIDDAKRMLCFVWDDRKNIYYSEFPLDF